MCRLFGQLADPELDRCEPLCTASNALRVQSHLHSHGWGIAWYVGDKPSVRRGTVPAHADAAFVRPARSARSRIVLAHVRDASVGRVAARNTHPFAHGPWVFAHNGTVARFRRSGRVRAALEAEIAPALRSCVRGETDSERCFYVFLTRLAARGRLAGARLEDVRGALAETVLAVSRAADAGARRRSSLNFLVSDGRLLAACRRGRSLHFARRARGGHLFALASEPIGAEEWEEVPEDGFAGIDSDLRVLAGPLTLGRRRPSRAGRRPGSGARPPFPPSAEA